MDPSWTHGEHGGVGLILDPIILEVFATLMILYFFILWFTCADRASRVGGWARTAQAAPAVQIHS